MTTLVLEKDPVITNIAISEKHLIVNLDDGRSISAPLDWYPRLMHGSAQERNHWRLLGDGYAIEWPDLDEHIGIEGLLAGRRSSESQKSLNRWVASHNTNNG